MPANYVLLERVTLTSAIATLTFDNIPQTGYTDLIFKISARKTTTGGTNLQMRFNGSTTGYSQKTAIGSGTAVNSYSDASEIGFMYVTPSDYTSNTFSSTEITVPNFTWSASKSVSIDNVQENMASASAQVITNATWANADPITTVYFQVANGAGLFEIGSSFALYGVAALGTTPVDAPKATGGDTVISDGTYWYHTFLASSVFTPNQNLTCDYLVIAGGGGAGFNWGGGAGAGGFRCTVTATGGGGSLETPLSLTAQAYPVTVGAGGSGGVASATNAFAGSDSVFATVTSIGGGRGGSGADAPYASSVGGSGGAGGRGNINTGSAGTANQGFAGGNADTNGLHAGGGGGAGAIGNNNQGPSASGNGGSGVNTSISGTSTTYAGGGGGGGLSSQSRQAGAGGSGGGGNGAYTNDTNGVAGVRNTGSGGGGGAGGSPGGAGGAGGSGIVIVRYTVA